LCTRRIVAQHRGAAEGRPTRTIVPGARRGGITESTPPQATIQLDSRSGASFRFHAQACREAQLDTNAASIALPAERRESLQGSCGARRRE
jgi:hypothetical protein